MKGSEYWKKWEKNHIPECIIIYRMYIEDKLSSIQHSTMSVKTFLLLVLLGFSCIQSGVSLVYTCNPSASCGCSKGSMMVSRIVNGETAEIDAWTWAVSLKIGEGLCGGSILSPSWIITAAHCLREVQVSDITVHAGSNNIWSNRQIKTASSIVLHPNYNPSAFTSDIALIKLASPLDMKGSKLRTICLPSVDSASLANKEWPEPNTTVRCFYFRHWKNLFRILGCSGWLGSIE